MTEELLDGAIRGSRRDLAKLLTQVELGLFSMDERMVDPSTTPQRIAITGSPGVGKSVLCDQLLRCWASSGLRVALLAVDPSSPRTGGALLGDRIRMSTPDDPELKDKVYVRSIATRRTTGSVPLVVRDMSTILLHIGFDVILIETVGAGQAEVRCAAVADRIVLVEGPARGDGIQAEKAGLLELADAVVVNKADLEGAKKHYDELNESLSLNEHSAPHMFLISALKNEGIEELAQGLLTLTSSPKASKSRIFQQLLAKHEQRLINHPLLNQVIDQILEGTLHIEEALSMIDSNAD